MIRVLIADDHTLVREGIRALLEKAGDIEVVGEASDGAAAVEMASRMTPDVLVADIRMPGLSGIQAAARVRELGLATETVILSMYDDDGLVRRALAGGARGYVLKDAVAEELLLAIRAARRGATYLSPRISSVLLTAAAAAPEVDRMPAAANSLTTRELEVVRLIGAGHTNRSIAHLLGISVKTVERHRTQLMTKLDVHNLVDLIRVGVRDGLIEIEG